MKTPEMENKEMLECESIKHLESNCPDYFPEEEYSLVENERQNYANIYHVDISDNEEDGVAENNHDVHNYLDCDLCHDGFMYEKY